MKKLFLAESWWGCLVHFVIIIALTAMLIIGFFFVYLPNTTNYGETVRVPNLENMDVKKAIHILKQQGLECIPQDTTFSLKHKLGAVVTQQPPAEALVKEGRHIYVTINKSEYPTITVDNKILKKIRRISLIQAENNIPILGFSIGKITKVTGFEDFVKECIVNGDTLKMDSTIELQIHTKIDLVVGNGEEEDQEMGADTLNISEVLDLELDNPDDLPDTEEDDFE